MVGYMLVPTAITFGQLALIPMIINIFIERINLGCQREGMRTRLIKNHLNFHLHTYIDFWGPPNGWNYVPNESHHKTEVKAP